MRTLFSNPGKKLKTLALVIFWIVLAFSVIEGIGLIYMGVNWYETFHDITAWTYKTPLIIAGILTPIVGILIAWLSSIFLYAFGQLSEDTAAIRAAAEKEKQ
ncbi:MAG: hypothetical protein J6Z79_07665 [Clostridia bacterium]|nr:hypothetical protein [Clostridia bacterium]